MSASTASGYSSARLASTIVLVLVAALFVPSAQAWTGQDSVPLYYGKGGNYGNDGLPPLYAFGGSYNDWPNIDLASTGTGITFPGNGYSNAGALDLGFTFNFFGNPYTQIRANAAGFLTFDLTTTANPDSTAMASAPNLIIAPFWARSQGGNPTLSAGCGGSVRYATETAPAARGAMTGGKVFIIQYSYVPITAVSPSPSNACGQGGFTGTATFQVRLYEKSDAVEIHYYYAYNYVCALTCTGGTTVNSGIHGTGASQAIQYTPATGATGSFVYVGYVAVQYRPAAPTSRVPDAVDDVYTYDYLANGGASGPGVVTDMPRTIQYTGRSAGSTAITTPGFGPSYGEFAPSDVGKAVAGTGIPASAKITAYSGPTSATMSIAATLTQSYVPAVVGSATGVAANDRAVGAAPLKISYVAGTLTGPPGATLKRSDGAGTSPTMNIDGSFEFKPSTTNPCGVYTFRYQAGDDWTIGSPSFTPKTGKVTINVVGCNSVPIADPQSLATPKNVALPITLTGSDGDSDPLTFTLTAPPLRGTLSALTTASPTSVTTTYTPASGYCSASPDSFTFKVSDGKVASTPAKVDIQVVCPLAANQAPTATATSYTLEPGSVLDTSKLGSGAALLAFATDPDGDALTPSLCSPPATGTLGPIKSSGDFVYTPAGSSAYTTSFMYKVTDPGGLSSACTKVTLKVKVNQPPTAYFTPSTDFPKIGEPMSFTDGSFDDGVIVSWQWDFGDGATMSSTNPQHIYPNPGTYVVRLTVTDDSGTTGTLSRSVTVTQPTNAAPANPPQATPAGSVAPAPDAGADIVATGATLVTLHGRANGQTQGVFFSWTQLSGPVVELSDAGAAEPSFAAPLGDINAPVELVFQLVTSDGTHASAGDTVKVTLLPRGTAPVILVSSPESAQEGQRVRFSANASYDADHEVMAFSWTQLQGPQVNLSGWETPAPTFVVPSGSTGQVLVFRLNVTDGHRASSTTVQLVVKGGETAVSQLSQGEAQAQAPTRLSRPVARLHTTPGAELGVTALALVAVVFAARRK